MTAEDRRWFESEEDAIREALWSELEGENAKKLVPVCIGAYEAWFALQASERSLAEAYAGVASDPNHRALLLAHASAAAGADHHQVQPHYATATGG